jgi:hypothetical protein
MDNECFVRGKSVIFPSMCYRGMVVFLLSSCVASCWSCTGPLPDQRTITISDNETIIAKDPINDIALEVEGGKIISISISHLVAGEEKSYRKLTCDVTAGIAGQWSLIDAAVAHGVPDITPILATNPNRYVGGCTIAVATLRRDGKFVIRYADDATALDLASQALQAILTTCATGISFKIPRLIYRPPQ